MDLQTFEDDIAKLCEEKKIPGVVLLASDVKGDLNYSKAFGQATPDRPITLDATFTMASCTKLMASIAALQCVERGQITLDEDLSPILTEFKEIEILEGIEGEGESKKPILKKAVNKITLRQLLTHTSGIGYDMMDPRLQEWRALSGSPAGTKGVPMMTRLKIPLMFEPGTSWMYGMGIDWAGVLVMRLNNTNFEEYMQKHIWDPLYIKDITFHQELKPHVQENFVHMTQRGGVENPMFNLAADTGKPVEWSSEELYDESLPMGDEYGGQGAVGSAVDYLEILKSLLKNNGKLLKPETVEMMFQPQLSAECKSALNAFVTGDLFKDTFASHPAHIGQDYGLVGALIEADEPTGRKAGTLSWSGLPNLLWTIDRKAGLATFYASNILPFGDHESVRAQQKFEKHMYDLLAVEKDV